MGLDIKAVRKCLQSFDLDELFREHLGWDNYQSPPCMIQIDGIKVRLNTVAQKRGYTVYVCSAIHNSRMRREIDRKITSFAREHFVIFLDMSIGKQIWRCEIKDVGKSARSREFAYEVGQPGHSLIQRLEDIAVSFSDEEKIDLLDVTQRVETAFKIEKVTKRFFERFKIEHGSFLSFITGIESDKARQWYASLMLNRLMFVYFIQKKGFLDGDTDYLNNRLKMIQETKGKHKSQSFYRCFLLHLFQCGLGKSANDMKLDAVKTKLQGRVPYLNGGFFEAHDIEECNPNIDIPDKAFEKLFEFFDQYSWHLDERPLHADNEINPDVVGYIFEKYINQKQMGAYYTKEDITDYISLNTIIPFLFRAVQKKNTSFFKPSSSMWCLLRDDPDRFIYPSVRKGVVDDVGRIIPLPKEIEAGIDCVDLRDEWNSPAHEVYALPTETWREHVTRRQNCLEIRDKMRSGKVCEINILISLNLDILQFALDVINKTENPEFLLLFWNEIAKISVLDPTCGSGAFLLAALHILERLYTASLKRMNKFIVGAVSDSVQRNSMEYKEFRKVLYQVTQHCNDHYYILKSIIINNLFGVDIMPEAIEICRLRLFLKLVSQVETAQDIEPLPDIDFNIRVGNTLVGFVSLEQIRKSQEHKLDLETEIIENIEDDARKIDLASALYRDKQVFHDGMISQSDKCKIIAQLNRLNNKLDCYLAEKYGVSGTDKKDFGKWKNTHKPFHWFVEFYSIMHSGGFNAIIGNPPYVEYKKIQDEYTVQEYQTHTCGNLYAFLLERCFTLANDESRIGMIVQLPIVCTDRMVPIQTIYTQNSQEVWFSTFGDRPGRLFYGLQHIRAAIAINEVRKGQPSITMTTKYNRWQTSARSTLFTTMTFCKSPQWYFEGTIPKFGNSIDFGIAEKLHSNVPLSLSMHGNSVIYYHNAIEYWIRAMTFQPFFWNQKNGKQLSTHIKKITFRDPVLARAACAALNSSLFYWWYIALSDCRDLNLREIMNFPLGIEKMPARLLSDLGNMSERLMIDLRYHKQRKKCVYKKTGKVVYDEYFPRFSKPIIDEIDSLLAKHYGLTDVELNYLVNYDIKFRT